MGKLFMNEKIKKTADELKKEIRERVAGYLAAAFGLVAGLAWNDAIKSLIEYLFPSKPQGVLTKFIYAIIITLVVVLITIYIVKALKREDKN